jgi:hypothetical protein
MTENAWEWKGDCAVEDGDVSVTDSDSVDFNDRFVWTGFVEDDLFDLGPLFWCVA